MSNLFFRKAIQNPENNWEKSNFSKRLLKVHQGSCEQQRVLAGEEMGHHVWGHQLTSLSHRLRPPMKQSELLSPIHFFSSMSGGIFICFCGDGDFHNILWPKTCNHSHNDFRLKLFQQQQQQQKHSLGQIPK